jgi:hypothetical protein
MTALPGSGLVYEGQLSLLMEPIAALPDLTLLTAINEGNELLLKNVMSMDEKLESDEDDVVMHELRRQDLKIRLVLELLSMLLVQNKMMPEPVLVRFSSEIFSIPLDSSAMPANGGKPLRDGDLYKLSLYVDPGLPRPLILYVAAITGAEAGWQDLQLLQLKQSLQDILEKFIFRQHRRIVAQTRKH